jgi:Cys-tRNA(Pro)/Cys-tRNA(Cys) deacylase
MSLDGYLREQGLWYRFLAKPATIHTVDAARVTGIELGRVTKNIVSTTGRGHPVLLIVSGDRRINLKAAAQALGVKKVTPVPFERAEAISGYPPGGTPSIGHSKNLRVVVDRALLTPTTVFCGGGSRDRLLELKVEDVVTRNSALVADISSSPRDAD